MSLKTKKHERRIETTKRTVRSAWSLREGKGAEAEKIHTEITRSGWAETVTSLPESMVSLSLLPSAEPEATMALSMSPVARWQTQYFSASCGACREKKRWFMLTMNHLYNLNQSPPNQTNREKCWLWTVTLFDPLILSESQPPALHAGESMEAIYAALLQGFCSRDYYVNLQIVTVVQAKPFLSHIQTPYIQFNWWVSQISQTHDAN